MTDAVRRAGCSTSATATTSTGRSPGTPTASRRSSCTAGRARRCRRAPGGCSTRSGTSSCSSTSASAGAARRTPPSRWSTCRRTRRPPGRRHGAAARAPRHRPLAGVGRFVGHAARPGLRRAATRTTGQRAMVLVSVVGSSRADVELGHAGDGQGLPGAVGALPRRRAARAIATAISPRRTPGCCRTPIRPSTSRRPSRGASGRTPTSPPCPATPRPPLRGPAVPAVLRPARHALLEQRLLRPRGRGAARRPPAGRHPRRDDQRSARHQRTARQRLAAGQGAARRRAGRDRRRGPRWAGTTMARSSRRPTASPAVPRRADEVADSSPLGPPAIAPEARARRRPDRRLRPPRPMKDLWAGIAPHRRHVNVQLANGACSTTRRHRRGHRQAVRHVKLHTSRVERPAARARASLAATSPTADRSP